MNRVRTPKRFSSSLLLASDARILIASVPRSRVIVRQVSHCKLTLFNCATGQLCFICKSDTSALRRDGLVKKILLGIESQDMSKGEIDDVFHRWGNSSATTTNLPQHRKPGLQKDLFQRLFSGCPVHKIPSVFAVHIDMVLPRSSSTPRSLDEAMESPGDNGLPLTQRYDIANIHLIAR